MKVEEKQLKNFLIDSGLVTKKDLAAAEKKAKKDKKSLADVLLAAGYISEEELIKTEAYVLGIPFVNLEEEKIDEAVLKIIPEPIARSHNIVAFRQEGKNLEVAMLDPEDLMTIDFIKKKANLKILPRLTTSAGIKQVLRQYSKTLEAEFGDIIKKEITGIKTVQEGKGEDKDDKELKKVAAELPVIATQEGGISDFLFDPERNPDHQSTGRAVKPRDPEGIARAVKLFIDDPQKTAEIIQTAKEMAFSKYDWGTIAKAMEERVF